MNEAEYLMKNYADRGGCSDITLQDLHNPSYDTILPEPLTCTERYASKPKQYF